MPSHRHSRARYSPSAHALNTRTLGPDTLISSTSPTGMTFVSAGTATATMTPPSSALQLDAGFADTLLRRIEEDEQAFVLRYVQPGLVGLIDGTLSTLAPIFAVALLSSSHAALLVGLATALGPASAWVCPKRSPMTAARPVEAHPPPEARSPGQ